MASVVEPILIEFREEAPAIRRQLARVPGDKLTWKPHEKSRSLGELASHVANLPGMIERIATSDEFTPGSVQPRSANSVEEIRENFEKNAAAAQKVLSEMSDEAALGSWRMVYQGKEIFRKSRVGALRTNVLNHLYHHRGQLSVYLRLLDVPVPSVYGPTADDNPFL
jgi:uncharacterized damage-inducible protein DinB